MQNSKTRWRLFHLTFFFSSSVYKHKLPGKKKKGRGGEIASPTCSIFVITDWHCCNYCLIQTVLKHPGNKMDYENNDSSSYSCMNTIVSHIFSKMNKYTRNSPKKPNKQTNQPQKKSPTNQGLQALSSSFYLWVLALTLICIDLIPRVSHLRSRIILPYFL